MIRSPRFARASVGVLVVAVLIYAVASWFQSLRSGASATGPGADKSRTDYGENGEPGSGKGSGDLRERPDAAARGDRGAW